MRSTSWIALGFLGLSAGCQQVSEAGRATPLPQAQQVTGAAPATTQKLICAVQEYCYQITGLGEKTLRVSHPTLKGKVFVSFLINSDLQISHEQVQAVRLSWKASGKPYSTGQPTLDSTQLQRFLPLVRLTIQTLHVQPTIRTDRSSCALERWAVPVTFE